MIITKLLEKTENKNADILFHLNINCVLCNQMIQKVIHQCCLKHRKVN